MPADTNAMPQPEQSLIPLVREREAQIKEMLEQARRSADETIQAAEHEAVERLKALQEELPRALERELGRAVDRMEAEARVRREAVGAAGDEVRRVAQQNLEAAVSAIVAAVWPKG